MKNNIGSGLLGNNRLIDEINKNAEAMSAYQKQISHQLSIINQLNYSIQIPYGYLQFPEIDISSFNQSLGIASIISNTIQSIDPSLGTGAFLTHVASLTNGLNAITKRMVADIAAIDFAWKNIISTDLLKKLHDAIQAKQDEVEAFCNASWPIAPSMTSELRIKVVNLSQRGKGRFISQIIIGFYRKNEYARLVETINGWKKHHLISSRMHIINDALDAHKHGKYTLSIPALIPQIEGILSEYVKRNNLVAKFGKINEIYTAAIGDLNSYSLAEWSIVQTLLHLLKTNTYDFTEFEKELDKPINQRRTTRHTVLHGVDINYHKQIHSLRAFLLIDAISVIE